jgi:MoaA/NifB/PqqE/SkfB family radical SAM enzyme
MVHIDTICVELTTRCPLRCVHCSALASPESGDFFPVDAFASLLGSLGALQEVYLSGGEPFEHPQFEAFVRLSARNASTTVAYSSGTQLATVGARPVAIAAKRLARAAMAGLSRIDFSLYSTNSNDHDAVTKVSGSFDALMATLRVVRSLGLPFGVHFVPLVNGGREVRAVASFARAINASRFHVLAVAPQGRAANMPTEPEPEFLAEVGSLYGDAAFDVVLSSAIRSALGHESTPRDAWNAIFVDVYGNSHAGEGKRRSILPKGHFRAHSFFGQLMASG